MIKQRRLHVQQICDTVKKKIVMKKIEKHWIRSC